MFFVSCKVSIYQLKLVSLNHMLLISVSWDVIERWTMKIGHMINVKQVHTFADYLNKFNSQSPGEYGFRIPEKSL